MENQYICLQDVLDGLNYMTKVFTIQNFASIQIEIEDIHLNESIYPILMKK